MVEAPVCQLSTSVGRPLLEDRAFKETEKPTELLKLLQDQEDVCSLDLRFGLKLGCETRKALNQTDLVTVLQRSTVWPYDFSENMRLADEALWKAGRCHLSRWQAVPVPNAPERPEHNNLCGYEACVDPTPPKGPMQIFNQLLTRDGKRFQVLCRRTFVWLGLELVVLCSIWFSRRFTYLALVEKIKRSEALETSVRSFVSRLVGGGAVLAHVVPWNVIADIISGHIDKFRPGDGVGVLTWRVWGHEFVLGLTFLISSISPLAAGVAKRRRLKEWHQKAPIWAHYAIDIILVEVATIFLLTSRFLILFGSKFSDFFDNEIDNFARTLYELEDIQGKPIKQALGDVQRRLQHQVEADWAKDGDNLVPKMMISLAEPLSVGPATSLLFVGAALLFYTLSTAFVTKCKLAEELPWITRWNAAIGGPLFLLSAVSSTEARHLCNSMGQLIFFRGLLLGVLLAVFLAPVDDFNAAIVTTLVFKSRLTRTPFVIAWLILWAMHILTGMAAVYQVQMRQARKDEERLVRDIDRQLYGALTPAARAEEGRGAESANRLPAAGESAGVQHMPGIPSEGQSPGPLKSQTFGET